MNTIDKNCFNIIYRMTLEINKKTLHEELKTRVHQEDYYEEVYQDVGTYIYYLLKNTYEVKTTEDKIAAMKMFVRYILESEILVDRYYQMARKRLEKARYMPQDLKNYYINFLKIRATVYRNRE